MEVVVTAGAISRAKILQSNCDRQQTNTQLFTGRMMVDKCASILPRTTPSNCREKQQNTSAYTTINVQMTEITQN